MLSIDHPPVSPSGATTMPNRPRFSRALVIAALMALSAAAAYFLTPRLHTVSDVPDLNQTLPQVVGKWHSIPNPFVPVSLSTDTSMDQPYDQSVMRSYVDGNGHMIQVAVAWGKKQRQEIKIHRPELCYPAQGLRVLNLSNASFPLTSMHGVPITGKRMVTKSRDGHYELVSYWIRIGDVYSDSPWQTRLHIFREGLAGRIPDGILVRVSQQVPDDVDEQAIFRRQEAFAAELVRSSDPHTRTMLAK